MFRPGRSFIKAFRTLFILRMMYMQYRAYTWTYINTDGVTGVDARTDRQTDKQTDCRFVASFCDHIHADHDP